MDRNQTNRSPPFPIVSNAAAVHLPLPSPSKDPCLFHNPKAAGALRLCYRGGIQEVNLAFEPKSHSTDTATAMATKWTHCLRRAPLVARSKGHVAGSTGQSDVHRRVAHVLVPKEAPERRDEALQRLNEGEAFADVAMAFSICPSKHNGGDLGWIWKGVMPPSLEAVAFEAPLDAVVEADSEYGYHLIKVIEERDAGLLSQMSVQELYDVLHSDKKDENVYIDCREEGEFRTAAIPGFKLYPLSQLTEWAKKVSEELDHDKPVVVLCHHGVRSMKVSQAFISMGFKDVKNVTGGIDAYSMVDPSVPRY